MKDFIIKAIPILNDNYVWLVILENKAIAIDCGDAIPIYKALAQEKLALEHIIVTHRHQDHIGGLLELQDITKANIIMGLHTADKLDINISNKAIKTVMPGDVLNILNLQLNVIKAGGHASDHIMYYESSNKLLFCGDILFSLGCGRVLDGDIKDLFEALAYIKSLEISTVIFPSHEYTRDNFKFVDSLGFFNLKKLDYKLKHGEEITLPVSLADELNYNPFLNYDNQLFKKFMNQARLTDFEFFVFLRKLKDNF